MGNTVHSSDSMDRSIQRWVIAGVCGLFGVLVAIAFILCATSFKRRRKLTDERSNRATLSKQRSPETLGTRISQVTSQREQTQEQVTNLSETREPSARRNRYSSANSVMPDQCDLMTSSNKSTCVSGDGNRLLSSRRTAKVSSSGNQATRVHVHSNKPRRVHSARDTNKLSLAPERVPTQPLHIPRARLSWAPPHKDRKTETTLSTL